MRRHALNKLAERLRGRFANHLVADRALLFAFGCVITTLWFITQPLTYTNDSGSYMQYAWAFSHSPGRSVIYFRTAGYPIFLVLTGVTHLKTFYVTLAVQFLMAVAIPLLAYEIAASYGRRGANAAGWLLVLSLIPYIHAKWIMTEQLFIFLQLVAIVCVIRYLHTANTRWLYLMIAVCLWLALTRPIALLFFLILLAVCWIWKAPIKQIAFAGVLYVAGYLVYSLFVSLLFHPTSAGLLEGRSLYDKLFYELYLAERSSSDEANPAPVIRPGNGPGSRELLERVRSYLSENGGAWSEEIPAEWFGRYANEPERLALAVFEKPNGYNLRLIQKALYEDPSTKNKSHSILATALLEGIAANPRSALGLIGRMLVHRSYLDGKLLFWNALIHARFYGLYDITSPFAIVRSDNGPYSRLLFDNMSVYARDFEHEWKDLTPFADYGAFAGRPEAWLEHLVTLPDNSKHWLICRVMDRIYGPEAADNILREVAVEAFRRYPRTLVMYLDNMIDFLLGIELPTGDGYRLKRLPTLSADMHFNGYSQYHDPLLSRPMLQEIRRPFLDVAKSTWFQELSGVYGVAYVMLKLAAFVGGIIALFLWFSQRSQAVVPLLWALVLYQTAATCIFAGPNKRYVDVVLPLLLMLMAIGFSQLYRFVASSSSR